MKTFPWLRERHWIAAFLSPYQWFRKLAGGKWELWWVDVPVCSYVWHDVSEWTVVTGHRPTGLCRGTPTLEDWG